MKTETKYSEFTLTISKWISNFFNPLTSLFLYFVYYSYLKHDLKNALLEFAPIFLILILPISVWIFWNVKKGKYSNIDVSNRNERKSLYVFIGVAILIYLLVNYKLEGALDYTMLYLLGLMVLMQLSNFFIKSSMHTAINIFAAALFYTLNIYVGIFWLVLSIIVGITRIILKRHTVAEVLMGGIIAVIVSLLYLYTVLG